MKTTFTVLLLGLLLCGCSQRWAKSNTPAIDLVEAGKDIPWGNGVVVHVTKRTGNSIERVRITSTAPDGQQTTVTANNGTLTGGSVENPRDERFVRLTLREVTSQSARQSWTAEELMIVLGK